MAAIPGLIWIVRFIDTMEKDLSELPLEWLADVQSVCVRVGAGWSIKHCWVLIFL